MVGVGVMNKSGNVLKNALRGEGVLIKVCLQGAGISIGS